MSDKGSEPPTSPAPSEKAQSPTPSVKSAKKSPRGRPAKSPRGPPQPTPEEIAQKEKSFLLDCIAVDTISKDFSHCQPKLGPAIPAYNSQKDKHVKLYFSREQVDETLRKTQQDKGGCSIDGPVIDRFIESGAGYRYLHARNAAPGSARAGHSVDQISGHGQFLSDAKPNFGYNGEFGYRRNSPWLRQMPSPFGVDPRSPTH
ncbi:sperm microtubule associated protein 1-like [Asterias amurensis]|uniref:sperm microtubule associated protein 1-like n=1 Tax=Asterias amurensis TaxID=7602 RepID=UPI003AB169E2